MFNSEDYEKLVGFLNFFELENFSFEGFFPFKYTKKSGRNKVESFFTKISKGKIVFTESQVLNNLNFNSSNGMSCSIDFDSIIVKNIEDVQDEFIMTIRESKEFIDYYKTFMKKAVTDWLAKINIADLFELEEEGTTIHVVPIHKQIDMKFISFELVDDITFTIESKTLKNIDDYKFELVEFKLNSHFTKIQFYENQIENILSRLDSKLK